MKIYPDLTPNNGFLSGLGAEEPTVYGWSTKVGAPFMFENFFFTCKKYLDKQTNTFNSFNKKPDIK